MAHTEGRQPRGATLTAEEGRGRGRGRRRRVRSERQCVEVAWSLAGQLLVIEAGRGSERDVGGNDGRVIWKEHFVIRVGEVRGGKRRRGIRPVVVFWLVLS